MKVFCLVISIFTLILTIYYIYAVIINHTLNRKKSGMFVKKNKNKYALFLILSSVIFSLSTTYLVFQSLVETYKPFLVFDLTEDYEKIIEKNTTDELHYNSVASLLNDYNCDVSENNNVYGITSSQLYKINCDDNEYITRGGEKNSERRDIILVSNYVAVSYAYTDISKVIVYNKEDLSIYQTIIVDGEIINLENVDDKISLLVCNEVKSDIGVVINDDEKQYLQELKYLKKTSISNIVSHVLIDVDSKEVNQKGFCFDDFYFAYDEYYYLVGNIYIDSKRENKCFSFRYNPEKLEIVKYAFFDGNVYMSPYIAGEYIYMNTYDQENEEFYAYQLNNVLNICSREGIDSSDNKVLDYLLNQAKVYNLDGSLYIENFSFSNNWSAFRFQEDFIVFQEINNELYINRYLYTTNNFQTFVLPFEDDFDEVVFLSFESNDDEFKLLFRTNEKVGYIRINLLTGATTCDARSGGCRMFITDNSIIIIADGRLEIVK